MPTHVPDGPVAARPFARRLLAGAALLAVASGCSASHSTTAHPTDATAKSARAARTVDAAALSAYVDRAVPTTLPAGTGSPAEAGRALARTLPPPNAAAGHDAASVGRAMALAARLVATTRLDEPFLCGRRTASPLDGASTPTFRAYLAAQANRSARLAVEPTIGTAGSRDDCGTLRWAAPGAVPGAQTWSVTADGPGLTVRWSGVFGYALADASGRQEPWHARGHVGYRLVPRGDGWALDGLTADTHAELGAGWPHDVPVPAGYLPVPATPGGDPAALKAVRAAAAAWLAAPASTTAGEAATDEAGGTSAGRAASRVDWTDTAAPARGDAVTDYRLAGTVLRSIHVDRGRRTLRQTPGGLRPKPGRTVPARAAWLAVDETQQGEGTGYSDDPYVVAALLGRVDAAAPTACPAGLPAARCYAALVVNGLPGDPITGGFTSSGYRLGRPYLVLDVGLDDKGRPAFLRTAQADRTLGRPSGSLTGTTRFTGYPAVAPPPPALPDPATVVAVDDVEL